MWAAAVRFLAATDMRESEVFGLQRSQISADGTSITLTTMKAWRAHVVPLSPTGVGIVVGIPRHIKYGVVFRYGDGLPYRNVPSRHIQIRERLNAADEKAGRKRNPLEFRFHDLRHPFAVNHLRDGGSIYDLQLVLGHSSVKVTEMYLDYVDPTTRQRAMRLGGRSAWKSA